MSFRLLTVGDGDLTFSLALKRAYPKISVTASTLVESSAELCRTYANAAETCKEFQEQWNETIIYGADATKLVEKVNNAHHEENNYGYDMILFNHPHLGDATLLESEQRHAERHYALLAHYFHSAKDLLKRNGRIHVCLCGNQPKTWKVILAAKNTGLECISQESTAVPIYKWLFKEDGDDDKSLDKLLAEVQPHYPTKRKFRNGSLGSKHFLARYGYRHQRTEGDLFDGSVKHINVEQSINFVFSCSKDDIADRKSCVDESFASEDGSHICSICKLKLGSREELNAHLAAPALPDIVTGACFKKNNGRDENNLQADPLSELSIKNANGKAKLKASQVFKPIHIDDATILIEATVDSRFDSKRIKWLCRQDGFPLSRLIKSKSQCEDAIKKGRVFVNQEVAFDSGRIVKENDVISLVEEYQSFDDAHTAINGVDEDTGFRVVKEISSQNEDMRIEVVYKPVGIRCVGSFSPNTLEMMTKKYAESSSNGMKRSMFCHPVTKLDTGCAGLCVLAVSPSTITAKSMHPLNIVYTFTALVHGNPPGAWKSGVYVTIPMGGLRQWKRQKTDQQENDLDSMDGPSSQIVTSNNALDLDGALFLQCNDSLQIEGDQQLSTITLQSKFDNGRLANVISFVLRKLGHPVVNDRFGKREYSALPRRIKNIVKQKVCIGCCCVDIEYEGALTTVGVESHKRTLCSFWREILS